MFLLAIALFGQSFHVVGECSPAFIVVGIHRPAIVESPPVGFERVRICDAAGCRYEWRPMSSAQVQRELNVVSVPANVDCSSGQCVRVQRRGLFRRR